MRLHSTRQKRARRSSSRLRASRPPLPPPADPALRRLRAAAALRHLWLDDVAPRTIPDESSPDDIFADALALLANQGDVFLSGGLVFLDPAFATELLKPLVDHRLSRERAEPHVEEHVRATLGATLGERASRSAVEQLLRAVEALKRKVLREPLLPFLWRGTALRAEDYPHAIRMLCESGVLFELPPPPEMGILGKTLAFSPATLAAVATLGSRQWAMPMRLPKDRPGSVGRLFRNETLEEGQTQIGLRFDFHGNMLPPGVIERCVAAGVTAGQVLECWYGGVLVADPLNAARTKGLLELTTSGAASDGERRRRVWLEIEARGACEVPGLWRLLTPLRHAVRNVLEEYPGVYYAESLLCPRCRSEGRWASPTVWSLEFDHEFDLENGRKTHEYCQECDALVEPVRHHPPPRRPPPCLPQPCCWQPLQPPPSSPQSYPLPPWPLWPTRARRLPSRCDAA